MDADGANPLILRTFDDSRFHVRVPNYEAQRLRACNESHVQYCESLPDHPRKLEDSQRLRMQLTPILREQFDRLTQDEQLKFICRLVPEFRDAVTLLSS